MIKKTAFAATLACVVAFAAPTAAAAATQILSFGGTLQNGFNGQGGPFGASNTSLTGQTYSVTLSYDPSLFITSNFSINSCGPNAGTSCTFAFSTTRTLTETIIVNGITQVNILTAGTLTLNSSGNDNVGFSFQNTNGLSLSGFFSDGNGFFPNQANVNNPIFSNFTNMMLSSPGTFNQSGPGYSLGANPTRLTALYTPNAVPEPASWAMMIGGFAIVGAAMRRRAKMAYTLA